MKKEHHLQRPKYKITRGLKKKRKKKKTDEDKLQGEL